MIETFGVNENLATFAPKYKVFNMSLSQKMMKKHLFIVIALLCAVVQGAWADGVSENIAPTNLTATCTTANTATISWTGYGDSYNLRYVKVGQAKLTLSVSNNVGGDGSGYQMLLDADHNTYGTVIPETDGQTNYVDASTETYANFEYKIPEYADGDLNNVVNVNNSVTIIIPAGTYDWCITNPTPNGRVRIVSGNGNISGRQNDFVFKGGKHYTFAVTSGGEDYVDMTVEDDSSLEQSDTTNVTGITSTSFNLSGLTALTDYVVDVQSVKDNKTSEWSSVNFTTLNEGSLDLYDNQDNSTIIANNKNKSFYVTLQGRTLYKDDSWNTLCLPFNVTDGNTGDGLTFSGTPFQGATVMELDIENTYDNHQTGFDTENGILYLYFKTTETIVAGKPYLIKWTTSDNAFVNPVFNSLSSVTISSTEPTTVNFTGGTFSGSYAPVTLTGNDASNLYLGADNNLYYPSADVTINSFRAYFHVDLSDGNGSQATVRAFVLNFGDEETTGVPPLTISPEGEKSEAFPREGLDGVFYTLDGRRLNGKPIAKGVYINNGKKIVVK
jgi:hypothetical protein